MNISKTILGALCLALSANIAFADPYKVQAKLSADEEGAMAYIVNFDSGENVDSVLVADGMALFKGNIDEPILARLIIDGNRYGQFILEGGSIVIDTAKRKAFGSPLNDTNNEIGAKFEAIRQRLRATSDEAAQKAIFKEYETLIDSVFNANIDNIFGYALFIDKADAMTSAELKAHLEVHPHFKKYIRVQKLILSKEREAATSEGCKFVDFEVTYDGATKRLSDYVGKGDYVLVDYWASWCGPCMRQAEVLKDIYAQYSGKGLKILGVAVWDEPENTLRAIKDHNLPWENIINAQNIPTDLYGISGIPCIILYGPDGTILSRGKQSNELRADVAKYVK